MRAILLQHGYAIVPRLPHDLKVDVTKCHTCHAKRSWLCDCATPATWNQGWCHQVPRLPRRSGAASRASRAPKPRPSAPPSTISARPATQNDGGCEFVPRLPRDIKVDVSKCHTCHAKRPWMCDCATPATWNQGGCHQVPRLPRRSGAASRASRAPKPRPSAPPSTISATPATQNDGGCEFVPRLPRDIKVDVTKCHACHAKRPWMCDCATPATWNQGGCHQVPRLPRRSGAASRASRAPKPRPSAPPSTISATPATQNDGGCEFVPRLPRDIKVDVTKCHACHAKRPWMCDCATPATWNQGWCHQVPRLPRRSGAASRASRAPKPRPSAPPSTISARPATQNDGGCEFVPRLPRDIKVDVTKCHACHAKRPWMCDCATPATWNQGGCHQVPRLPRKTMVAVSSCHACHVISRWMSPSATPATQKWRGVTGVTGA